MPYTILQHLGTADMVGGIPMSLGTANFCKTVYSMPL